MNFESFLRKGWPCTKSGPIRASEGSKLSRSCGPTEDCTWRRLEAQNHPRPPQPAGAPHGAYRLLLLPPPRPALPLPCLPRPKLPRPVPTGASSSGGTGRSIFCTGSAGHEWCDIKDPDSKLEIRGNNYNYKMQQQPDNVTPSELPHNPEAE